MTEDELDATIHALGVRIEYTDLPPDRDGEYLHHKRLIRLQRGLATRLRRCVKAHECAHAVFADVESRFGPVNAKAERRADEWAALRLIALAAYKRAEILHEGHIGGMAIELNVTTDLLEVYRAMLLVVEDADGTRTYVKPGIGDGQWAAREVTRTH